LQWTKKEEELKQQISDLETASKNNDEKSQHQEFNEKVEQATNFLQLKLDEANENFRKAITENRVFERRIKDSVKSEIQELQRTVSELTVEINRLRDENNSIRSSNADCVRLNSQFSTDINSKNRRIEELLRVIDQSEHEKLVMQSTNQTNEAVIIDLRTQIASMRAQINGLSQMSNGIEQESDHENELKWTREEVQQMINDATNQTQEQMNTLKKTHEEQLQIMRNSAREASRKVSAALKEIEMKEQTIRKLETQLENNNGTLNIERETAITRIQQLESELETTRNNLQKYESETVKYKQRVQDAEKRLRELRTSLMQTRSKAEKEKNELTDTMDAIELDRKTWLQWWTITRIYTEITETLIYDYTEKAGEVLKYYAQLILANEYLSTMTIIDEDELNNRALIGPAIVEIGDPSRMSNDDVTVYARELLQLLAKATVIRYSQTNHDNVRRNMQTILKSLDALRRECLNAKLLTKETSDKLEHEIGTADVTPN
jgi:chromosome segregation ATPase